MGLNQTAAMLNTHTNVVLHWYCVKHTARTVTLLRQPAQREGLGGAGKSPNSFSMASSSDRMVESYPGGPTT